MAPVRKRPKMSSSSRRRQSRVLSSLSTGLSDIRFNVHANVVRLDRLTRNEPFMNRDWDEDEGNPITNLFKTEGELLACQNVVDQALEADVSNSDSDMDNGSNDSSVTQDESERSTASANVSSNNGSRSPLEMARTPSPLPTPTPSLSLTSGTVELSSNVSVNTFDSSNESGHNLMTISTESIVPLTEGAMYRGEQLIDFDLTKLKITDDDHPESSDNETVFDDVDEWINDWLISEDEAEDEGANAANENLPEEPLVHEVDDEFVSNEDHSQCFANEEEEECVGNMQDILSQETLKINDDLAHLGAAASPDVGQSDSVADEFLIDKGEGFGDDFSDDFVEVFGANYRLTATSVMRYLRKESKLGTLSERNKSLYELFTTISQQRGMTAGQENDMWELLRAYMPDRQLRGLRSSKKRFEQKYPEVQMAYEFLNLETGEVVKIESKVYPKGQFPRNKWAKISEYAKVDIADVWNHAMYVHENCVGCNNYKQSRKLDVFFDGLPCSKSGVDQLNVMSCRIPPCKMVYVIGMHVYRRQSGLTPVKILRGFVDDILACGLGIRRVIGDGPVRAKLKCLKQFNGAYSCEFCHVKGVRIGRRTVFPSDSMNEERRTNFWWRSTSEAITERGFENMTEDELHGMMGVSPLFCIPEFNMATQFVLDPMHNFGGCSKLLIRLMLSLGKNQQNFSAAQLEIMTEFDKRWIEMKIPREFNRHTCSMQSSLPQYKTQEYLSIVVIGLFAFGDGFESKSCYSGHHEVWLTFCFIVRAVLFDNALFQEVFEKCRLNKTMEKFYVAFEKTFGVENCTWNVHEFSHILEIRGFSRMPPLSALQFEGNLGLVKKFMKPQTPSFPKQVINRLFRGIKQNHDCDNLVRYTYEDFKRTTDNLIYTNKRHFYKVLSSIGDSFFCKRYVTKPFHTRDFPHLVWRYAGIERVFGLEDASLIVDKQDVVGKAVIDHGKRVIIAVPLDAMFT